MKQLEYDRLYNRNVDLWMAKEEVWEAIKNTKDTKELGRLISLRTKLESEIKRNEELMEKYI